MLLFHWVDSIFSACNGHATNCRWICLSRTFLVFVQHSLDTLERIRRLCNWWIIILQDTSWCTLWSSYLYMRVTDQSAIITRAPSLLWREKSLYQVVYLDCKATCLRRCVLLLWVMTELCMAFTLLYLTVLIHYHSPGNFNHGAQP